ncbi:MAG: alkyl sulfatase dimerization domain-containing protein, partial [Nitrososphaeraceae archaeon]
FNARRAGSGCHASTISKRSPLVAGKIRSVSWSIRGIYSGLVGWNTGDATWFNPVPPEERGNKIVQSVLVTSTVPS